MLLKAEILNKRSPAEAIAFLTDFLKDNPGSRPATGALAQVYVEQKRYVEARALFDRLVAADPANTDFRFGAAVLAAADEGLGGGRSAVRGAEARTATARTGPSSSTSRRSPRRPGRYDVAIERYRAVPDGERGVARASCASPR